MAEEDGGNKLELASQAYVESVGESYDVDRRTAENLILNNLQAMVRLLKEVGGIGLTAVQVGIPYKMSFYLLRERELKIIFNGHYVPVGTRQQRYEGCLTYPDQDQVLVKRPKEIRAFYSAWDNENQQLVPVVEKLKGLEARVYQHEVDHQLGKTIYME